MNATEPKAPIFDLLESLIKELAPARDRFPRAFEDLERLNREIQQKLARFGEEEQQLSIGVMGRVKAGKSSFLNALLFDGKPILPVAATPETANLVRITYRDEPRLAVEFYSMDEWREIETQAKGDEAFESTQVAAKLVEMANRRDLDWDKLLSPEPQVIELQHEDELLDSLGDYAGAEGRFTPFVKMIDLYLPRPELRGLEIVDTPGMNDPVASRVQKTRDYMSRCDVVFFLSRCGQFLDQSDMDLLADQLPSSGVKRLILAAAQFDSAIQDAALDHQSLSQCEDHLRRKLERVAADRLEALATQRERVNNLEAAKLLRGITQPIFCSTFAEGFARWPEERWNKAMHHTHAQLLDLAEEWDDYVFTREDWLRLGNLSPLREQVEHARADRHQLLAQQRADLIPHARDQLRLRLQALQDAVKQRIQRLEAGEIGELKQQRQAAEKRIHDIEQNLQGEIEQVLRRIRHNTHEIRQALQTDMQNCKELRTRQGTRAEVHSREVSTADWYNPFSWGSTETVYYTASVPYEYLSSADAIDSILGYQKNSGRQIIENFNNLLDKNQLRLDLRKTLLANLDTQSENFDAELFRQTLFGSLDRLEIPELTFSGTDTTQEIYASFSGEITDRNQMDAMRHSVNMALNAMFDDLLRNFTKAAEELTQQMQQFGNHLAEQLTQDINAELEQMHRDFTEKQRNLGEYQRLVKQIDRKLEEVAQLSMEITNDPKA